MASGHDGQSGGQLRLRCYWNIRAPVLDRGCLIGSVMTRLVSSYVRSLGVVGVAALQVTEAYRHYSAWSATRSGVQAVILQGIGHKVRQPLLLA